MRRGDLYRVRRPGAGDPRKTRVFVVVSREALIGSAFSTVICAPVFSQRDGLATQVDVGPEDVLDIAVWNNRERDLHLSDLSPELQEYMEEYIQQYVPRNRVVYHWFDVYDLEEKRL